MQLGIVGSADANNGAGRHHSCYWVAEAADRPLMIDFGGTALRALRAGGRSPLEIGALVFTHLHGDHIGGFPFFLVDAMFTTVRTEPLEIVGPPGTEARLEALVELVYPGFGGRARPFATRVRELAPGQALDLLGARIEAFAADHMAPPDQALCLRVSDRAGASVAFSGDTRLCPGLFEAAAGADLLVAECTGLAPPMGKHCTWEEWRAELPRVGAGRVLLSHLGEEVRAAIPRLLAQAPAGVELDFADDGQEHPVGH